MQTWEGWIAAMASAGKPRLTWDDWYARQQRIRDTMKHRQEQAGTRMPFGHRGLVPQARERMSFSDQELARLSFVRWLYQIGRLDPLPADTSAENETP